MNTQSLATLKLRCFMFQTFHLYFKISYCILAHICRCAAFFYRVNLVFTVQLKQKYSVRRTELKDVSDALCTEFDGCVMQRSWLRFNTDGCISLQSKLNCPHIV